MALLGASRDVLTNIKTFPRLINNVEANRLGDRVEVRQLIWDRTSVPTSLMGSTSIGGGGFFFS